MQQETREPRKVINIEEARKKKREPVIIGNANGIVELKVDGSLEINPPTYRAKR